MASQRRTEQPLILYYHPALYFSQRVVLALEEKSISYKTTFVDSQAGQHMSPWYRQVNPEGEVPSITHNGHNIGDSNELIEYLDKTFPDTPQLQPNENTSEGYKVRYWRNKINSLPVEFITFGCMMFRNELTQGSSIPDHVTHNLQGQMGSVRERYTQQFRLHPDGQRRYNDETARFDVFGRAVSDIDKVREQIGVLDMVLEEIENQLGKTRLTCGTDEDYWLVSQRFTAADIYLGVLLNRIEFAGLAYHFKGPMPLLTDYYARIRRRPSYKKAIINVSSVLFKLLVIPSIVKKVKSIAPYALGIGLVIAAVVIGYKYIPP